MAVFVPQTRRATAPDPAGMSPDTALIAAAQANPHAFGPVYERYYNRIFRYCYLRLGQRQAAEDAAADVFLKALANLHRYHHGVFAAWLYTLARHAVADVYQRQRLTVELEDVEWIEDSSAEPEPAELRAALEVLPQDQQAVLQLQLAGWPTEDIAAALDRSPAAIRMLRYRAVERLRQTLEPEPGMAQEVDHDG